MLRPLSVHVHVGMQNACLYSQEHVGPRITYKHGNINNISQLKYTCIFVMHVHNNIYACLFRMIKYSARLSNSSLTNFRYFHNIQQRTFPPPFPPHTQTGAGSLCRCWSVWFYCTTILGEAQKHDPTWSMLSKIQLCSGQRGLLEGEFGTG